MHLAIRSKAARRLLALFLSSTLIALAAIYTVAALAHLPEAAIAQAIVASCVLVGLFWIVAGWFLTPSVETYLGQGASWGIPIIGPRFANPERNQPVLDDLARKLSGQTDVGILFAALGFLLMIVGALYYGLPSAGPVVVVLYLAGVSAILLFTLLPPRERAAD